MADETTLPDPEETEEPDIPDAPDAAAEGDGADPWAGFPDVDPDIREKYKTPADAIHAYKGARRQQTAAEQEAAELRQYADDLEAYYEGQGGQPSAPTTAGGQTPQPGFDLAALIRQGDIIDPRTGDLNPDALAAVMQVNNQVLVQGIAQMVAQQLAETVGAYDAEQVAPLRSQAQQTHDAQEIAGLEATYGDRFDAVLSEAQRIHQENPGIRDAGGLTALFGIASAQLDARRAEQTALEAKGFTIDRSGRPVRPKRGPSPEEQELQAIEQVTRRGARSGVI